MKNKEIYDKFLKSNSNHTKIINFRFETELVEQLNLSILSRGYKNITEFLKEKCYEILTEEQEKVSKLNKILLAKD